MPGACHDLKADAARVWTFRILVVVISLELAHLFWHYTAILRAAAS